MPNQFFSPEGDIENYFVSEYWLIDQYIGDQLWTWGSGSNGQLGTNNVTTRSTPVTTFAGGTNWKQVSVGYSHTAAIKTDGTLWTWGNNSGGQHGTNNVTTRSTPVTTFAGGTNWKQVSCGRVHTAAIKTDGTLWTWGIGTNGQLGISGNGNNTSTPVTTFSGGTNWKQVSCGDSFTAAIKTDGTLWTWGLANLGQLGRPSESTNRFTPVTTFAGGTNWTDTAAGLPEELYTLSAATQHTAAIKTDGTLWIWGNSYRGRLGNALNLIGTATNISTPVTTFAGGTNWKQVSVGYQSTAAIKTDGTLWTWGSGISGELGTNDLTNRSTPVTTFSGGTNWKQVSCGRFYVAAIKTDGTLWTWGNNGQGRLGTNDTTNRTTPVTTFAGGTDWKQVSASMVAGIIISHTAAIKTDGTLWTWGSSYAGQLGTNDLTNRSTPVTTFAGGTNWAQVSCGTFITAAIKTDGTLWTWGNNTDGQLGTNDITNRSTPVTTFAGGTNWKQVSSGSYHTAAIKTDGTLWTWGNNTNGQLGTNDITNRSTPVTTFAGGTNWKQVSAGDNYTIALKDDGINKELYVWGNNNQVRLGNNFFTNDYIPNQTYQQTTDWKQVDSGGYYTAAIKTDGTLWVWGRGDNGQLGNNNNLLTTSTPVTTFAGGTNWKQVSGKNTHTAAIKTDGTLWTWGNGSVGQLGRFDVGFSKITPLTTFAGGTNWTDTAAGLPEELYTLCAADGLTAAIKTDGTLWTWGNNGNNGRLGTNDTTTRSTPVTTFAGGTNWKQITGGTNNTAAIKTDGTLWTWGLGFQGRLGTNDTTTRSTPVTTFAGGTDWKQVSASDHTAAIKTDGTLWTWGYNGGSGRLGTNDTTSRSTPVTTFAGGTNWKQVSAGGGHTAAIKTDGTLWTWGSGSNGQLGTNDTTSRSTPVTTFAGGTNWAQVSAGGVYTAAIKTDGTLWTWGWANNGPLGNGLITGNISTPITTFAGGSDWKQVSAGSFNTAAIKTDGTLWNWGINGTNGTSVGTNDIGTKSTPVTTFAGGTNWAQVNCANGNTPHIIALKTDGTLWTWGNGSVGQLGENFQFNFLFPNQTYQQTTDWKQVSSGGYHTAAIKTDGTLWTWGAASNGQLGTNDITNRSTPVTTFAGGTNWRQVSLRSRIFMAAVTSGISPDLPLS